MPNFRRQTVIIAVLVGLIGCASFFAKKFNDTFQNTDMVANQGTEISQVASKDDKSENAEKPEKKEEETKSTSSTAKTTNSFYAESRMARETQRTTMKQELESIVNNKNSTKEAKEKASKKIMTLIEKGEKEVKIETMVKEKGFDEALCIIDESNVEISVKSNNKLTSEKVNQIKDIAVRGSGVAPSGITIKQNQ